MRKGTYIILIFSLLSITILSACKKIDKNAGELTNGLFRPIRLTANTATTTVPISWSDLKSDNIYEVVLFNTDNNDGEPIETDTTVTRSITFSLGGGINYLVKVRALDTLKNLVSGYSELAFKTPTENLFNGFKTDMSNVGQGIIRWLPGSDVTTIKLTPQNPVGAIVEYLINSSEKNDGEKTIGDLANNTYLVELYNNNIKRGVTNLVIEGDIVVPSGGDLAAAIEGAPENSIILLEPNGEYLTNMTDAPYVFKKGIKIRGASEDQKAVIYTSSTYNASDVYELSAGADLAALDFENIIFNGIKGNVPGGADNRYLFRFTKGGHISRVSFINCEVNDYSVSFFMLHGTGTVVDSLIIDNSILHDIGPGSSSGLIRYMTGVDQIHNVLVTNSTFYKIGTYLIYGSNAQIESVLFNNCTLNEIAMGSIRMMYFGSAMPYGADKGIQISNSLFGKTLAGATRGINPGGVNLSITDSYCTSDYDDSAGESIRDKFNEYSGASTNLWNDPEKGIFTFKDLSFTGRFLAGDPRWQ